PVLAAEYVLDDLDTVQPMLHVVAPHDDPGLIPLAGGPNDPARSRMEPVVSAGAGQRIAAVSVTGIVEHLHLRRTLVNPFVPFLGAVENAAVAARPDLPIENQLEIRVLLDRNEVAARSDPRERAVV